ncbi:Replication factor A protein 1 [Tulasnella sp. 330]|nr:Replication factor A protein 1 [Tulasnella sp. 330]KAG8885241.1 Replication factor A protein 1 [Tulasnella sp. 331]KAG8887601.1 Replication factor A protein 1 [Tulasnella sp. 332]
MTVELSKGIIDRMMRAYDKTPPEFLNGITEPVLQVLFVKPIIAKDNQAQRNRLIISDGAYFAQSLLATTANHLVDDNQISKFTIVRISNYSITSLSDKRLIILHELCVVAQHDVKIGEPVNVEHVTRVQPTPTETPDPSVSLRTQVPVLVHPPQQRPQQQQPKRPQQTSSTSSRPSKTTGPTHPIFSIESLSPYENKWTIKAHCTNKSDIIHFREDGKLFNITLMDETGQIRATAFNDVVDELYDRIEEGKVYFISKARVNIAKKKFAISTSDYELKLEKTSEIEECLDRSNVPIVKFNFHELSKLEDLEKDAICDVIGIVKHSSGITELTSKAGKQLVKRDITLVDKSQYIVRLTLWGKQAEQFMAENQPVIAFKGVKVGDFGGRTLSMISSSKYYITPDIPEAHILRGWFDSQGHIAGFHSHLSHSSATCGDDGGFKRNEFVTCRQAKDSDMGQSDNKDYFSCRGTVVNIKGDSVMYAACPGDKCRKKVNEGPSGGWRCRECERDYSEPEYRYMLTMSIVDWTDELWVQVFNDTGVMMFGMTAQALYDLHEEDPDRALDIVRKAKYKTYSFWCHAKQERWNDRVRIGYGVNKILPLEYRTEGHSLLTFIKQYEV